MAGLNEKLTAYDTKLFDGQSVSATATSSGLDFETGALGSIEIVAEVEDAITVSAGATLTIAVLDDDVSVHNIYSETYTADGTLAAGLALGNFVVPTDTAGDIKASITSAAVSGSINVFANYLAR